MKKRIPLTLILLLLCTFLCVGCDFSGTGEGTPVTVDVTYVLNNGEADITETVTTLFGIVKAPTPTRENYIFAGWYQNEDLTRPYDITVSPKKDITLYAAWYFDYENYVNTAWNEVLPSTVKITAYTYTSNFLGSQITSSKGGSGVVIYEDTNSYYVLSNHHVIYLTAGGNKGYTVTDLYEKEYDATLLYSSAEYDLALLRMQKKSINTPLVVAPIATEGAQPTDICLAVGSPTGIRNVLTLGNIIKLKSVSISEVDKQSSNVTFPVLWHTAPIDSGSSGGALFDENYQLVGINYAVAFEDDTFLEGYAVPAEKIREFLNLTILSEYF